jgi:hypothetical protein
VQVGLTPAWVGGRPTVKRGHARFRRIACAATLEGMSDRVLARSLGLSRVYAAVGMILATVGLVAVATGGAGLAGLLTAASQLIAGGLAGAH